MFNVFIVRTFKLVICLIFIIFFFTGSSFASSDRNNKDTLTFSKFSNDSTRKKVGLVLSGGGAKGVAHIGLIQALEENGIPIDYIAGTSAGAIIGGLYAAGYTPAEMLDFFLSKDFNNCLKGKVDDKYLYYFSKSDPDPTWLKANFRITKGNGIKLNIPSSVVSPKMVDFFFMEFFSAATAVSDNNFDSLFVPFRCVATDITNQRPYYFKDGDLGLAIRASMTFPFYFSPISKDDIILFDGGIYDNFPINTMREDFKPDVVIGCKVANNFPPPREGEPITYLQKLIAFHTDYSIGDSLHNIMIEPDVPIVNVIDFSSTAEITKLGYNATIERINEIKKIVGYVVSPEEVVQRRNTFNKRKPPLLIDSVIVKGANPSQAYYIRKLLQERGNPKYSLEDLKMYYFRFFSDENIKYVQPSLLYSKSKGEYDLLLKTKINRNFGTRLGGNLSFGSPSQAFIELDYWEFFNVSRLNVRTSGYLGRFYNSIGAFFRSDFSAKLPLYLGTNIALNNWDYFRSELFYFNMSGISYLREREQFVELEVGIPTGKYSKFTISGNYVSSVSSYYHSIPLSNDIPDRTSFSPFSMTVSYEQNNLDYVQYASKGRSIYFYVSQMNGEELYISGTTSKIKSDRLLFHKSFRAKFGFNQYLNLSSIYKLGFLTEAFYTNQSFFSNYTSSILYLGGFYPTVESTQRYMPEFRASEYFAFGLQNVFKITSNLQFRIEGYLFQPLRDVLQNSTDNTAYYSNLFERNFLSFSTGFVYHSPIGPVSILFNYMNLDNTSFNKPYTIVFNIGYVLYNQRGIRN